MFSTLKSLTAALMLSNMCALQAAKTSRFCASLAAIALSLEYEPVDACKRLVLSKARFRPMAEWWMALP